MSSRLFDLSTFSPSLTLYTYNLFIPECFSPRYKPSLSELELYEISVVIILIRLVWMESFEKTFFRHFEKNLFGNI